MKKLLFFLFTLVVLASGCGKKNTFTLEGSIKGLPSDTILVFYQEPDYKLDTILLSKGKFTYTIPFRVTLSPLSAYIGKICFSPNSNEKIVNVLP